ESSRSASRIPDGSSPPAMLTEVLREPDLSFALSCGCSTPSNIEQEFGLSENTRKCLKDEVTKDLPCRLERGRFALQCKFREGVGAAISLMEIDGLLCQP